MAFKTSAIQYIYDEQFRITRGYSTKEEQFRINPKVPNSSHILGLAVDLLDLDGKLGRFFMENQEILVKYGFYMEALEDARDHVHLQLNAPKSGRRVFIA